MTSFTNTTTNYPQDANTPIKRVKRAGAPTPNPPSTGQAANYVLGDEWLDTLTGNWWKLANNPTGGVIWVIIGGSSGTTPIDSIQVDASTPPGTNPVLPTAGGLVTTTGGQVAPGVIGANVIRTNSLAANTWTNQIQQTSAVAAKDTTKNGVSHFNSNHFSSDQGFISLVGGGQAVDSFTTTVGGPVTPDGAGNVALTGATSTYTNGSVANTVRTEVQGTNHGVILGQGANTPATSTAAGAVGTLFVAQGASADPLFATSAQGDFTFTSPTAGATRTVTSTNTDNTSSTSNAVFISSVGGTSAGDPYFSSVVGTARSYSWGTDTSDSQKLKINTTNAATASPSSGTNLWTMTSGGARTMPLQPCFFAYVNATVANVTGNGTDYTVVFNAVNFDQASNFNTTTGIFTAPVTGRYFLTSNVTASNLGAGHTDSTLTLIATAYNVVGGDCNPGVIRTTTNNLNLYVGSVVNMTAGNTASINLNIANSTKTVGVAGAALPNGRSVFSGYLIC